MALSITINKVAVADSFAAGTKVADIVVSGGTSPYSYSLASGGDYFQISGTEIQVKDDMNIDNIQSFSVTVIDSTSGTVQSRTSEVVYPNITAAIQSRFNSSNKIYKITQDIDLGHGVLTIPAGCTLDFQGGSITTGSISGDFDIRGECKLALIHYHPTSDGSKIINFKYFNSTPEINSYNLDIFLEHQYAIYFPVGTYQFSREAVSDKLVRIYGDDPSLSVLEFPNSNGIVFSKGNSWNVRNYIKNIAINSEKNCVTLNDNRNGANTVQVSTFENLMLTSNNGYCVYNMLSEDSEGISARPYHLIFKDISLYTGGNNLRPYFYGIMGLKNRFENISDFSYKSTTRQTYFQYCCGEFRNFNITYATNILHFLFSANNSALASIENEDNNIDVTFNEESSEYSFVNCNFEGFNDYLFYLTSGTIDISFDNTTWTDYSQYHTIYATFYCYRLKRIKGVLKHKGKANLSQALSVPIVMTRCSNNEEKDEAIKGMIVQGVSEINVLFKDLEGADNGAARVISGNKYSLEGNVNNLPIERISTDYERVYTTLYAGFTIYDTNIKKMILWNGTAWVNIDGTALEESTALNNIEEIPASEDKTN